MEDSPRRRAFPEPAVAIEPGDVDHRAEPRNLRGQQPRHPEGGGEGDERPHPRVRQDARVTAHVIFELVQPRGRIDRHRDRARHLHREEGREVVETGRQHQRRGLTRLEPAVGEAGRDALGAVHQRGERDPLGLSVRCIEFDVHAFAVLVRVEVHRLEQGRGAGGDRIHGSPPRFELRLAAAHRHRRPLAPIAGPQRRQQLPRRLRVRHHRLGDGGAERALEPREQLHAREAVESEIAIERAVEGDLGTCAEMGVKLGDDLAHRRDQRLRVEGPWLGRFFLRAIGHGARHRRDGARRMTRRMEWGGHDTAPALPCSRAVWSPPDISAPRGPTHATGGVVSAVAWFS